MATISAGVRFDVTKTWTMTDSTTVELKPGQTVTVYAKPLYAMYSFEVRFQPMFGSSTHVGFGTAGQAIGICTVIV